MIVTDDDRKAFAHHVLVDTTHRFVFFSIPKVACTDWIKLFARMLGAEDWYDHPAPHSRLDRPLLSNLSAEACTEALSSPDWFRAVFFRDPVERLLSAYLDKFVQDMDYGYMQFGFRDLSFEDFLTLALDPNTDPSWPSGLHSGTDPHWRAQSLVGNVGKFAYLLDFVGRFDRLQEDTILLLSERGLWDDYGASGWGHDRERAMFEVNDAVHRTDARSKIEQYFSTTQLTAVREAYRDDYALFERLGLDGMSETGTLWSK